MNRDVFGIGLGLRNAFLDEVAGHPSGPDFFEVFPHHFHGYGGRLRRQFEACVARFPLAVHNTTLSVGGLEPLHPDVVRSLRDTVAETGAGWWSDHLCWSGARGAHTHELIPLPFTREVVRHVAARAREAQERVGAPIALENVSALFRATGSEMDEAAFTAEVLEAADARMLLDVNNVVVNCKNFGGDPRDFIDRIPMDRVVQIHLSGHTVLPHMVVDTHICPIPDEVWELYRYTLRRAGRLVPTLIEWDQAIPDYPSCLEEVAKARSHAAIALAKEAA